VYANAAHVLLRLARVGEALVAYAAAVQSDPSRAEIRQNYAAALLIADQPERALEEARAAIALRPAYALGHFTRAQALENQLRFPEAVAAYERAIALDPGSFAAHQNRGIALLTLGDFDRGWPEFAWRRRDPEVCAHYRYLDSYPIWDGSPLAGKRIVIVREGGHGDFFQMMRFLPEVQARGGVTVVEIAPDVAPLAPYIAGIDEGIVSDGRPPAPGAPWYLPMLDLPRVLGVSLAGLEATRAAGASSYLAAPPAAIAAWRAILGAEKRLRVGLVWAGNPANANDARRSAGLAAFAPLGGLPGVAWYGLQAGPRAADPAPPGLALERLTFADFGDTAGAIANLDLVITVDTSVAHLAGALGRPVWVVIPFVPEWRWLLDRAESPWYPSLRLFRQARPSAWDEPFTQIRAALQQRLLL